MMKLLLLCFVAALWVQLPSGGDAECCTARMKWCDDCTSPTPFCSYGGCNVFGCNCAGGCRTGRCGRFVRSVETVRSAGAHRVITAADQDGDGRMSLVEARAYLVTKSFYNAHVERSLEAMDVDNDNFVSAGEIDSNTE